MLGLGIYVFLSVPLCIKYSVCLYPFIKNIRNKVSVQEFESQEDLWAQLFEAYLIRYHQM